MGGWGGHLSHYPTSIQLSLTIPRFLQKRLNLREGRIPRAEISLGAFRSFCFCLFAFANAHSECAWSVPHHHRPPRAGVHTPPASLGAGLRTRGLQTCGSPLAAPAKQLGEHLARPHPPSSSRSSKSQTHRRGPEKVPTSPPDPEAPPLHPRGFPGRSLLPHPLSSAGGLKTHPVWGSRGQNCQEEKR